MNGFPITRQHFGRHYAHALRHGWHSRTQVESSRSEALLRALRNPGRHKSGPTASRTQKPARVREPTCGSRMPRPVPPYRHLPRNDAASGQQPEMNVRLHAECWKCLYYNFLRFAEKTFSTI